MTKMGVNIYKEARKKAEFKREPAAEELGIAVRTLDKYESFELRVPDDIVRRMCYLYQDPSLAWRHIKRPELSEFLPDIEETDIKGAALGMADDYLNFDDLYKAIVKIVSDGKVCAAESEDWQEIRTKLFEFAGSLMTLAMSQGNKSA